MPTGRPASPARRSSADACRGGRRSAATAAVDSATRHAHRLGGRRRLVEQRCVRHLEARQLGDRRLEVEQRFQPALADLRLVRRVGRVPRRVLEHVALDHAGRDGGVVAHPDQAGAGLVLGSDAAQRGEHLRLAARRREVERLVTDRVGDRLVEQCLERADAEGASISSSSSAPGPTWRRANSSSGLGGAELGRVASSSDSPGTRLLGSAPAVVGT